MNKISKTFLGDLIEFQRGYDLPKSDFKDGNIPVISSNGILGYHNQAKVKGPGITIGRSGTVGLPHFINEDFFPHNTALFIKDFKGNFPKYIFYLLKTLSLNERGSGSGVPTMNRNHLHPLVVSAHLDFYYQQKIASVLSSLDSKIELNNRINAELEAMAKTLYDYWFVQFDFPDKNGKPYKTSGGAMVWNEELKRGIPEEWEVKKMGEVLAIKNGRDHKHLEFGTIPVYGSGGIMRYASSSMYDSESILIPRKGTLGNLFYINKPFWCVDTIFYTQMKFPHSCKYLFYTIRAFNISSMNTGTAVPSMTTEILNNLLLVFPPMGMLEAFDAIVSPIFQKEDHIKLENQELTELRDWLLPMLMNGQVKVS
jgi:type I restriction enzyme S subunit